MSNQQEDTSGWPLDMQLKWALRHGKNVEGLENMMVATDPVIDHTPIHKKVVDEDFDHMIRSVNQEIASLRSELPVVGQSSVLEDKIDQLGKSLNQEIACLRSELPVVVQSSVLEDKIDQLGKSLNQEIASLRSEFAIMTQGTGLEEQIENLEQSFIQEIVSLKSEFTMIAQGAALQEQVDKLTKSFSQEILSLRNEFGMFVQAQLQQEKAWKLVENEWKNSLQEREAKLEVDIQEILHHISGKFAENFQYIDERLQKHDHMLREEITLVTGQLTNFQQAQDNKEETLAADWQKKMEERQIRLVEDMEYIHYVLEEIATRPQSMEAQQKLREKFLIREMAVLKEKMESVCQACQVKESSCMMTQGDMTVNSDIPLEIDKKSRRRRR